MQLDDPSVLVGATVQSVDGITLGPVSAVHVPHGTDQPLFVQVTGVHEEADAIVPLVGAAVHAGMLTVAYPAVQVRRGPTVDPEATLSVGEVAYVLARYRAGTVEPGGRPLTERATEVGDVAAEDPAVRPLPPIVVIRPGFEDDPAPGSPSHDVAG